MKIHPVFHVDHLRHYQPSPPELGPRTPAKPAPITIEDEEEYFVEGIADHRTNKRKIEYLVQWEGYLRDDWTWEPEERLAHCKAILNHYNRNQGLKT